MLPLWPLLVIIALTPCAAFSSARDAPLVAAVPPYSPPYISQDFTSGFLIDVTQKALDRSFHKHVSVAWADLATKKDEADILVGVLGGSDGIYYSESPILSISNAVVSHKGAPIRSMEELTAFAAAGGTILAFKDAHLFLGDDFAAATESTPNYYEYEDQFDQVKAFYDDMDAVAVMDPEILHGIAAALDLGDEEDALEAHLFEGRVDCFAGFTDKALRDAFDAKFNQMCSNGSYMRLAAKYKIGMHHIPDGCD